MDTLKNMLTPVGVLPDTLKLVVLGGSAEAVRRVSYSAWSGFVDSFFLTAHFNEGDDPYEWLMCWLNTQPGWERSRELDVAGRPDGRKNAGNKEEDHLNAVAFQPSMGTMNTLYYRGHWLRITRAKDNPSRRYSRSSLKISVVARNNDIIKKLVLEAKRLHQREEENRVNIYVPEVEDESWVDWEHSDSRKIRPMSSIVLPPEVKDSLIADCFDFLSSEAWYAERGIPFRRGYLLHGVPGSGKTSLINALAGALNLDIYVLSLSGKEMSDTILLKLLSCAPPRCIMLLEDLDAAFTQSTMREQKEKEKDEDEDEDDSNGNVSLAGLLNALDGVGASEGRLLFATTNHIERLDPALKRPGRMDVQVHFGWATRWQAEGMFKRFFEGKNCVLSVDEMGPLAKRFADAIPEDELSVAALQGYLLKNKTRPKECVEEFGVWIVEERERQKLRKAEMERKAKEDEEKKKLKKEEDAKKKKEAEAEEKKKEEEEKKKAVDSDADSDSEAE